MAKTDFDKYIAERIKENQGVLVPVKASLFELMFVKKNRSQKDPSQSGGRILRPCDRPKL